MSQVVGTGSGRNERYQQRNNDRITHGKSHLALMADYGPQKSARKRVSGFRRKYLTCQVQSGYQPFSAQALIRPMLPALGPVGAPPKRSPRGQCIEIGGLTQDLERPSGTGTS